MCQPPRPNWNASIPCISTPPFLRRACVEPAALPHQKTLDLHFHSVQFQRMKLDFLIFRQLSVVSKYPWTCSEWQSTEEPFLISEAALFYCWYGVHTERDVGVARRRVQPVSRVHGQHTADSGMFTENNRENGRLGECLLVRKAHGLGGQFVTVGPSPRKDRRWEMLPWPFCSLDKRLIG